MGQNIRNIHTTKHVTHIHIYIQTRTQWIISPSVKFTIENVMWAFRFYTYQSTAMTLAVYNVYRKCCSFSKSWRHHNLILVYTTFKSLFFTSWRRCLQTEFLFWISTLHLLCYIILRHRVINCFRKVHSHRSDQFCCKCFFLFR